MALDSGLLRHRVRIEELVSPVDSFGDPLRGEQGEILDPVWTLVAPAWAAIEPLSGREFIQSAALQAEITTRIVTRFREGITAAMRFVHEKNGVDYAFYNLHGVLPDKDSGQEYITFPASQGVNNGQ